MSTDSTAITASEQQLSPLHTSHVAAGASFTDFAGWQMPVRYLSDLAEHAAVRTSAGIFDLSHMGEILVLGVGAGEALDYALSANLSTLAVHRAKYSLLLAEDGGIIDDLIVYRTGEDRFLVVANASNRAVVADALRERAASFDALVEDESDDIGLIAVQGPRAVEILLEVDGFADELSRTHDFTDQLAALKYYWSLPGTFRDSRVLFARTGYTGEDGFEIFAAPDRLEELWEAILETGAGTGLMPAGLACRDTLRLEAGMPLYGHELSLSITPFQAGLGRAVDFGKEGDFVGRLALESALDATESAPDPDAGPSDGTVLVGLISDGRRAGRAGYDVYSDASLEGEPIGSITSGALSPTLGRPIAMAYVERQYSAPGTQLFLDVRGNGVPATVATLPFYRRKKTA